MLYKFLPSEHAESFVNRREVLFRSLAYFRKLEDAARGDPNEGVEIQAPSEPSVLISLETGARVMGQLPVTSFIDQQRVFAFCCSSTFSNNLFAAFGCNACVIIEDPASFFERCSTELRQRFRDSPVEFLHGAVRYRERRELSQLSDRDPRELPFLDGVVPLRGLLGHRATWWAAAPSKHAHSWIFGPRSGIGAHDQGLL